MSVDTLSRVFRVSKARNSARLLLLALADRCDEFDTCFPSHRDMIARTLLSRDTVIAALKDLEAAGEIKVLSERPGAVNRYMVTVGLTAEEVEARTKRAWRRTAASAAAVTRETRHRIGRHDAEPKASEALSGGSEISYGRDDEPVGNFRREGSEISYGGGRNFPTLTVIEPSNNRQTAETPATAGGTLATSQQTDYLGHVFARKVEAANANGEATDVIAEIERRVANPAWRDACKRFAREFPGAVFGQKWIGSKGGNIEQFIAAWRGDDAILGRAVQLAREAAQRSPMFAPTHPLALVNYIEKARVERGASAGASQAQRTFTKNGYTFTV